MLWSKYRPRCNIYNTGLTGSICPVCSLLHFSQTHSAATVSFRALSILAGLLRLNIFGWHSDRRVITVPNAVSSATILLFPIFFLYHFIHTCFCHFLNKIFQVRVTCRSYSYNCATQQVTPSSSGACNCSLQEIFWCSTIALTKICLISLKWLSTLHLPTTPVT